MNPIFTKMINTGKADNATPDDCINPTDGLKYRGKCRTPKEAFLSRSPSNTKFCQACFVALTALRFVRRDKEVAQAKEI